MGRRYFEGLPEVIAPYISRHPETFMDLLELLYGLSRDISYEGNQVTPYRDPRHPEWVDYHSAPFDDAYLIFKVEREGEVVRFLQANHRGDFNPN